VAEKSLSKKTTGGLHKEKGKKDAGVIASGNEKRSITGTKVHPSPMARGRGVRSLT